MPRSVPITDEQRAHVLRLCRGGEGRNAIVRATGLSAGAVTKIVQAAGLNFDRKATEEATRSRKADLAARRAELEANLLDDAARLRLRLWQPMTYTELGTVKEGFDSHSEWVQRTEDVPLPADQLKLVQAVSQAIAASQRIADAVGDEDTESAKSMLVQLFGALEGQWRDLQATDA